MLAQVVGALSEIGAVEPGPRLPVLRGEEVERKVSAAQLPAAAFRKIVAANAREVVTRGG